MKYRGRFAPSPSGPLHFGSLVAAMGSYLEARSNDGEWLVRIEDIDTPREVPGAADDILRTLEAFGFEWDQPILYQSRRIAAYQAAIEALGTQQLVYDCVCSRRQISAVGHAGIDGYIYPGTCRSGIAGKGVKKPSAIRLRTADQPIVFCDAVCGEFRQNLAKDIGDFILRRADGLYAYQLAVVVDDAFQGITHVVRGVDLLSSTPRQIYLQHLLRLPTPRYSHLPLVINESGRKLSKQSGANPVLRRDPLPALEAAFNYLGQVELGTRPATVADFWELALQAWDSTRIPCRFSYL